MKRVSYMIVAVVIIKNIILSDLMAEELLIVRVNANYIPYEMVFDGKLTGLHVDLVNATARRLGIKVRFKSLPWKRAIQMIKTGNADAITYIGKTPEREKFVCYDDGNILSSSAYGFICLKNRASSIKYNGDLISVFEYKIGVQRGYSYGPAFDKTRYLNTLVVDKVDQFLALLLNGRVDLAVIDEPEYLQNRSVGQWQKITFLKPDIIKQNFYIGFSRVKKLERLTVKFAKELTAFKRTKEYQTILTKYRLN